MNVIIYKNEDDGISIVYPSPDCELSLDQIAKQVVPHTAQYITVCQSAIPSDLTFRNAWEWPDMKVNLKKAKNICHEIRRNRRSKEFEPYDKIIALRIPGTQYQEAESCRQKIREKYTTIQKSIDDAASVDELKFLLEL